ncbi:MAG: hypothetical protein ACI89L_000672 [Phycisphaerales bacterium]|jgi:hypothetical protein
MKLFLTLSMLCAASLSPAALGGDRDIQFRSMDLDNGIVEVHNFGAATIALDGWQFCTHDFDQQRRYSSSTGLDGLSIAPGDSLFVHFNDDAPANPGAINIATIGGSFALPLNSASYALEIFTPGLDGNLNFGSTTDMNDHVQWAINPASIGSASARSVQAAAAGLWTASSDYITVTAQTGIILLTDESGGELHGPNNYVLDPGPDCPADLNGDGIADNGDIGAFVQLFLAGDLAADFNGDGILDNGDIGAFVLVFLAGC